MNGKKKHTRKLLAAGFVLLLAALAFLALRDYLALRRLTAETAGLQERVAEATRQIKVDIPKMRDHLADLEDEQQEFEFLDRLPDEDGLEALFDTLSEIEQEAKVQWTESKSADKRGAIRDTLGAEPVERLQYTLDVTGGFFAICRFMNLIETMPRFAQLDEFTIRRLGKSGGRSGAEEGPVECEARVTLSVFRLKPTAAPKTAGPPARAAHTARAPERP